MAEGACGVWVIPSKYNMRHSCMVPAQNYLHLQLAAHLEDSKLAADSLDCSYADALQTTIM
jgi:hypothetical protein